MKVAWAGPVNQDLTREQLEEFLHYWQTTKAPFYELVAQGYGKEDSSDDKDYVGLDEGDIRALIADLQVRGEGEFTSWGPFQVWERNPRSLPEPIFAFRVRDELGHWEAALDPLIGKIQDFARALRVDSQMYTANELDSAVHDLEHALEHSRRVRKGIDLAYGQSNDTVR